MPCALKPVDSGEVGAEDARLRTAAGRQGLFKSYDVFLRPTESTGAFRGRAARQQAHGLTQYPAMMVPEMQAVLVRAVARADGNVTSAYDPFAGSGTTLVECMRLGLDFAGQDVNPLAVLFCRTKSGPFPHAPAVKRFEGRDELGGGGPGQEFRGQLPRLTEVVRCQGD